MKKKIPYPLQKVTLNLRDGDFAWLRDMHGREGASHVVREIIRKHVDRSKAAAEQLHGQMDLPLDAVLESLKDN